MTGGFWRGATLLERAFAAFAPLEVAVPARLAARTADDGTHGAAAHDDGPDARGIRPAA